MRITIETDDLDRLAHALLIAKADYLCNVIESHPDSAQWAHQKRSIEALDNLYDQLVAALEMVEGVT